MTVAGRAYPVDLVADLGDGFQVMRFRRAVGLVGGVRELLDVAVPRGITHPRWNHQRVGGLGQRCRTAYDLLPVVVGSGGEIVLALCVDDNSVDLPDDRRGRTQDVLHEGLHVDMGLEGRYLRRVIGHRSRW